VLRVEPKKDDQAPSAILELVDGPKDMRFALTAKAVARRRSQGLETLNELTLLNVRKVTQFRKNGVEELEKAISKVKLDEVNPPVKSKATMKNEKNEEHARVVKEAERQSEESL
jgi:hypothetical protein